MRDGIVVKVMMPPGAANIRSAQKSALAGIVYDKVSPTNSQGPIKTIFWYSAYLVYRLPKARSTHNCRVLKWYHCIARLFGSMDMVLLLCCVLLQMMSCITNLKLSLRACKDERLLPQSVLNFISHYLIFLSQEISHSHTSPTYSIAWNAISCDWSHDQSLLLCRAQARILASYCKQ